MYLATLTVAKVMLDRAMRDAQVQQVRVGASSELALPRVDRVLDMNHGWRLNQIDAWEARQGNYRADFHGGGCRGDRRRHARQHLNGAGTT